MYCERHVINLKRFNLPAIVMLIAGLITCIFNIINKINIIIAFRRLIIVLIIFYIIGLIANTIIRREDEREDEREDDPEDGSEDEGEEQA